MPITWKNVNSSGNEAANNLFNASADRLTSAFGKFGNVVKGVQDDRQAEYDYGVDQNVQSFLDRVKGYNDVNQLQQDQASGLFQNLIQGYDGQVDRSRIDGAVANQIKTLRDGVISNDQYNTTLKNIEQRPQIEEVMRLAETDAKAATALANQYGLGVDVLNNVQSSDLQNINHANALHDQEKIELERVNQPKRDQAKSLLGQAQLDGDFSAAQDYISSLPVEMRSGLLTDLRVAQNAYNVFKRGQDTQTANDGIRKLEAEAVSKSNEDNERYVAQQDGLAEMMRMPRKADGSIDRDNLTREQANALKTVAPAKSQSYYLNQFKREAAASEDYHLINPAAFDSAVSRINQLTSPEIAPGDQQAYSQAKANLARQYKIPPSQNVFSPEKQNFDGVAEAARIMGDPKWEEKFGAMTDRELGIAADTIAQALNGGMPISVDTGDGTTETARLTPQLIELALGSTAGGWFEIAEDLPGEITKRIKSAGLADQYREAKDYQTKTSQLDSSFKSQYLQTPQQIAKDLLSANQGATSRTNDALAFNVAQDGQRERAQEVAALAAQERALRERLLPSGDTFNSNGDSVRAQMLAKTKAISEANAIYDKNALVQKARKGLRKMLSGKTTGKERRIYKAGMEDQVRRAGLSIDRLWDY
jgi:hypothetical protein